MTGSKLTQCALLASALLGAVEALHFKQVVYALNAGLPMDYVDSHNIYYFNDTEVKVGTPRLDALIKNKEIKPLNGQDHYIYGTERTHTEDFGYTILDIEKAGPYVAVFKFLEHNHTNAGERKFDIYINNLPAVKGLDIAEKSGAWKAHDELVPFYVAHSGETIVVGDEMGKFDGTLNIEFRKIPGFGNPTVSAFYIAMGTIDELDIPYGSKKREAAPKQEEKTEVAEEDDKLDKEESEEEVEEIEEITVDE